MSNLNTTQKCFFEFSKQDLEDYLVSINTQKYRAKQIWDYVFKNFVFDFEKMSSLPISVKERLWSFNISSAIL